MSYRNEFSILVAYLGLAFLFLSSESAKLVDLTHQLTPDIPVFSSPMKFNFTEIFTTKDPYWLAFNSFCTSEHTGTHLDAPYHFHPDSWKTHEIPIDRLVAPAVVINISARIEQPEKYAVTLDDLHEWERFHGTIPRKSVVFMFSGWDRYWENSKKYINNDKELSEDVRTPGFSPAAATWLVTYRDIVGIGVDTATVEVGMPSTADVHRIVSAVNVYCLENVANLARLPPVGATVYAFPINIKGGTGAPARIIASVPDQDKTSSSSALDSLINFVDLFV